jgi:predicted ribosomally synthesized peptide with SipW-like signal peptide
MKKVLFAVIACVLCAGMIGGAFAYFTDVEKSTGNTMSAGTLDLQISNDGSLFTDSGITATFSTPTSLEPGTSFTTNAVWFKNTGSMDIYWIFARICGLTESEGINTDAENALELKSDISKYIILQNYQESADGSTWFTEDFALDSGDNANAYLAYWNSRGASFVLDGEISLYDLYIARNFGSGDKVTSLLLFDGGNLVRVPILHTGDTAAARFTFKLAESTPNNYQGDSATFEVDFIASAHHTYPDDTLVESGLEALGY